MNSIIGRQKEIHELNQVYESGKAEFAAIYGRSRVGKIFFVDECLKGKITFRHARFSPVDNLYQCEELSKENTVGNIQDGIIYPDVIYKWKMNNKSIKCLGCPINPICYKLLYCPGDLECYELTQFVDFVSRQKAMGYVYFNQNRYE